MNILILNTSPKAKGGASRSFSRLLKMMLLGNKITTCDVRGAADYENALSFLENTDTVIISSPLYVDGIPANSLAFLTQAEQLCTEKKLDFKLYVLSNSGFIEARQNTIHLKMYEAFCERAGVHWGCGLGIGGGVMLHVLYTLFPIYTIIQLLRLLIVASRNSGVSMAMVWAYGSGPLVMAFLFIWPLLSIAIMAYAIRTKKSRKNLYTRPLLPSFLFIIVADLFMILSALLHGVLPHKLFKKITVNTDDNKFI